MARPSTRASILSIVLLLGAGALVVSVWAKPGVGGDLYEATARFQIRSGDLAALTEPSAPDPLMERLLKRLRKLMNYNFMGRPAIEQVIKDLRLSEGIPHTAEGVLTPQGRDAYEALITSLQRGVALKIEADEAGIMVIAVTVRYGDQARTVKIANQLIENYMRSAKMEMDETLLGQKKDFDLEVNRYMMKVRELENARTRFLLDRRNLFLRADGRFPEAIEVFHLSGELDRRKKAAADAAKRLDRLKEFIKDKSIGDAVILELMKLEAAAEETAQALIDAELQKEQVDILNRNFFQVRTDYLKIERELGDARDQLTFWLTQLRQTQMALTMTIGERGMRFNFIERAAVAKPVE